MGQMDELFTAPYAGRFFVAPFRKLAIIHIAIRQFLHEGTGSQVTISWIFNPPHPWLEVADDFQDPLDNPVCQIKNASLGSPCLAIRFTRGASGYEVEIPWAEVFPEGPAENIRDNFRVAPGVHV